jgi:hypothetical protein
MWSLQPSEFWQMSPREWWLIYDGKMASNKACSAPAKKTASFTKPEIESLRDMFNKARGR